MNVDCTWKEKMRFVAKAEGHEVWMDAKSPIGQSSALTPKELLLAAICGCTSMDVVGLLRKYKQNFEELEINAQGQSVQGVHPAIFKEIELVYKVKGSGLDTQKLIEAVSLSQTTYCGVSAMVSKAVPIHYSVELNGLKIHQGAAQFHD